MRTRLFSSLVLAGGLVLGVLTASTPGAVAPARQAPTAPSTRPAAAAQQGQPAAQGTDASADQALLKQYCVTCHNDRAKTGSLTLEGLDLASVGGHTETWETVVRKIRTGMMPPSGMPRPDRLVLDAFASRLESRLDRAHVPGDELATAALHRLNRTEYANAIRDLLHIEVDVTSLLPGDGSSEGFDNIAEALSISPP